MGKLLCRYFPKTSPAMTGEGDRWGHKKGLPYEDFLVQQSFLYENLSTVEPRAYFC